MKNVDMKKLLVFILIIALLILAAFGVSKLVGKGSKPSKEVQEEVTNLATKYYATMTEGYTTEFNGIDALYSREKTTYDDINKAAIIYTAIRYAEDNDIDLSISREAEINLEDLYGREDVVAYNAEQIRKIVKKLFNKDLVNKDYEGGITFAYNYYYDQDTDTYTVEGNPLAVLDEGDSLAVKTKVVDTVKKGDDIIVSLIVAYVYPGEEGSYVYYSESDGADKNRVAETTKKEFVDEKDDSFNKYEITLKKASDGYAFESIEKIKKYI